jgi:ribosome biogenesis GTPase A
VDVFLFLADARIPRTSIRLASPYLSRKKRVFVLAKPDLGDPRLTARWLAYLRAGGTPAFAVHCRTGEGLDALVKYLKERKEELDSRRPEGVTKRPIRLMLFGPPNVGKSSLANRLLGTAKAPFGATPGLTRGSHWLRGRGFLEVLDTPGVIETSQVKGETRMKLAAVWALRETAYEPQDVAFWLALNTAGGSGASCRGVDATPEDRARTLSRLEEFGRQRGFLKRGGVVDLDRTSTAFIHAFREGQLGRFTLEEPPDTESDPEKRGEHTEKGEQRG